MNRQVPACYRKFLKNIEILKEKLIDKKSICFYNKHIGLLGNIIDSRVHSIRCFSMRNNNFILRGHIDADAVRKNGIIVRKRGNV